MTHSEELAVLEHGLANVLTAYFSTVNRHAIGLDLAQDRINAAYLERNQCVALLAKMALALGLNAGLGRHEGVYWEDDWRTVVYIELESGQVSWHIHDSDRHLFDGLPTYLGTWDGHDTPEKYRRVGNPGILEPVPERRVGLAWREYPATGVIPDFAEGA